MSTGSVIALVVTVALAGVGYIAKYLNNLRLAVRKDALDRINSQLGDLYGPLLALLSATHLLYHRFSETEFTEPPDWTMATDHEKQQWQRWMSDVLMPLNRRMTETIITHAHLIEEDYMPPELLTLCAHISGYDALTKQWARGNYDRMLPYILFPKVVGDYVEQSFQHLKGRQAKLLGTAPERGAAHARTLDQFRLTHPRYFQDRYAEPK